MSEHRNKVALYTLAGVFTAPRFLDAFRERMLDWLAAQGWAASAATIYPYGNWYRTRWKQAAEIALDFCRPTIGGRRAVKEIQECRDTYPVLLIGHSGGGVAAVQAAKALLAAGRTVGAVVMIGSPKTPIPRALQARTLFVAATDEQGREVDRIARLGSWRGRAPDGIARVAILGGHPDYFRDGLPYVNQEGHSNIEMTEGVVRPWLLERLKQKPFA
jgi:pimeloyl-ACP methyl ester carboxylesterase